MRSTSTGPLAVIISLGAIAGAFAADIPVKAPRMPVYKAPRPVIVDNVWSGLYFGGHIGGGWMQSKLGDPSGAFGLADVGTFLGASGSGVLGGPQVGFNWQFGGVVLGVQGDIAFTDIDTSAQSPLFATTFANTTTKWITTATGRVGYAWDRLLIYGKGGGAWVREHYSVIDQTFGVNSTAKSTRSGWVAGAGLEYAFLPNWSTFIEYNYIGIGTKNDILLNDPTFGQNPLAAKHQLQIAKVGLNYRFMSWPR